MPGIAPSDAKEMAAMALRLIARLEESNHADDLFAAVIATVHVVDWHFEGELGLKQARWPKIPDARYHLLRDYANGLKHFDTPEERAAGKDRTRLATDDPGWGHPNWWGSYLIWTLEFEGRLRPVADLCREFLVGFEANNLGV